MSRQNILEKLMKNPDYRSQIERQTESLPAEPARRKHGNEPTADATGRIHPSRLQARVTDRLRLGNLAVIPEVSIPLSHRKGDRMRVDCLVIERALEDGRFVGYFADPKGMMTEGWKQKARRFEDAYGVPIIVITK